MPQRIRVLDEALADQIAAGEVVERPSSVVKELLENALDAGARSITVEVAGGGVELIRVTDDGEGMSPEDARLAVRRHATSKISSLEDLGRIGTLGFRGEALPSIASVSRLVLITRPRDREEATRLAVEGGSEPEVRAAGAAPGTIVEVKDLFWNVPARRKFLKSPATESAHVVDACLRAALARPELRLVLIKDGRRVREMLPAADLEERARALLPDESLARVEGDRTGVRVLALLGAPERARTGTAALHVFVNGRPVRDRVLARAVAFAYGSVLPPGRFPTGAVHIEVPVGEVDVNVHPQKSEVRFARGREVVDGITRALAAGLGTVAWSRPPPPTLTPAEISTAPPTGDWIIAPGAMIHAPATQDAVEVRDGAFSSLRFLAQVRRLFLVCEGPEGIEVIDQHAADERVRFHRLREAFRARDVAVQRLLFPERVELAASDVAAIEEHGAAIRGLGLDVAPIGPTTVAVHAVPAIVSRAPPARLLRDVLDQIAHDGERAFGDAVDMVLATMACHGAIRAGDALSPEECVALLRAMDAVPDFAGHCPHGRPVVYRIPFGELERRLGR